MEEEGGTRSTKKILNDVFYGKSFLELNFFVVGAAMDSLSFLAKDAPGFAVRGSQVKILTHPSQFYEELCKRAGLANNRIVMVNHRPCCKGGGLIGTAALWASLEGAFSAKNSIMLGGGANF